jgi:segregation and condensation protein B
LNLYQQETKEILEALLLCSSEPLSLSALIEITGYESGQILEALSHLQQEYVQQGRGFEICEIAGGWMFATFPRHASYLEKLLRPKLSTLSQASLEVLSIVAYRQPVTRGEMEEIRGVNCDSPVNTLLERNLIRESGRKDAAGRPILFATTTDFLKYFGLTSLQDLPPLEQGQLALEETLPGPESTSPAPEQTLAQAEQDLTMLEQALPAPEQSLAVTEQEGGGPKG